MGTTNWISQVCPRLKGLCREESLLLPCEPVQSSLKECTCRPQAFLLKETHREGLCAHVRVFVVFVVVQV